MTGSGLQDLRSIPATVVKLDRSLVAVSDTGHRGAQAGQGPLVHYHAARDEFENPDTFNVRRNPPRVLSFGAALGLGQAAVPPSAFVGAIATGVRVRRVHLGADAR